MRILESVYNESLDSERYFAHKRALFIGSESYDAPTITVLQGLSQLGFAIHTIKKPNINSWFCNQVVESVDGLKFDFVLSNLHWGTRWSYYHEHSLMDYPKILIDGDDDIDQGSWRKKYDHYVTRYVYDPPESTKDLNLMPYRWIETLSDYEPDVVFTAQKQPDDSDSLYLPFGIHEQYTTLHQGRSTTEREIDFAHIPGPGKKRRFMKILIRVLHMLRVLPGCIHNGYATGEEMIPDAIRDNLVNDHRVHGYYRWVMRKSYFELLNNSKVLIYPGTHDRPFRDWDSKRPWEAYASGCLVLLGKPSIDVKDYPITEVCDYAVYDSTTEFIAKGRYLYKHPHFLDELRVSAVQRAWKYFSPVPIARYFLMSTARRIGVASRIL
jgi:hypothetical protein